DQSCSKSVFSPFSAAFTGIQGEGGFGVLRDLFLIDAPDSRRESSPRQAQNPLMQLSSFTELACDFDSSL
ncbi:MAG: hypothetical protein WBV65_16715, partial [Xanthobacteraceae bacterium]